MPLIFIIISCVALSGINRFFFVCMTCRASGKQGISIMFDGTQINSPQNITAAATSGKELQVQRFT